MNRLKQVRTVGKHTLALLIASGLLLWLLWTLMEQPITAQTARTPAQAALEVGQTVGETPGICAPTVAIAITAGRNVYYCVTLRNNGTVPLVRHTFASTLGSATFSQTIEPGQVFQVTANVLTSLGASGTSGAMLSQIANASLANTVTVTSTTVSTEIATDQATARVVIGSAALKVTKTVGLTDNCATTKGIAVDLNTLVKYCVTMQNSGTLPLITHRLVDPLLKVDVGFTLAVPPGATLVITDGALRKYDPTQRLEYFVANAITNTITLTSTTAEGVVTSNQDRAVAAIGRVSTALSYTVSAEDQCGSSVALSVVTGRTVYHCLRLTNNGTLPLETHTIGWTQPPATTALLTNVTITETIQPGQSLVITRSRISQLGQANVTTTANNEMAVTSRNRQGMVVTTRKQAQVTVGTQVLTVNKYATINPSGCVTTAPLTVISDQPFYYCVVITNTGQTPLVRHTLSEPAPIAINSTFTYPLAPGQRITLTNDFLVNTLKLPAIFGPFRAATSFLGTLTVNSFSAANVAVTQASGFQVNVTAATPTGTSVPTLAPTLTPSITPTPTPTPTLPPTPTPTPVVVSFQPTPTQPFSINSVATPTAGVIPGSLPPEVDQFGQPLSPLGAPTVDIASTVFALTIEAAATQTALAFLPPPVIDTPIPPAPIVETPIAPSPLEIPSPTLIPTAIMTGTMTPTTTTILLVLTPLATPTVDNGYLGITAQVFQVSTATLGWIWFLVGSIVFFAAAGMFAGLGWQRRSRNQAGDYDMSDINELNPASAEPPIPDRTRTQSPNTQSPNTQSPNTQSPNTQSPNTQSPNTQSPDDDDYWPTSLR